MEDREGNMWVGTSGGGACRVRRRVLTMLDDPGAPVHQTARAFCEDLRGDVWVALQTGELFVRQKHQWRHLAAERDWPGRLATTVAAARNGDVWIATGDQTLVRWDGEAFSVHALPPKDDIKRIRAMMVARDGKLWFGRGNHVMHGLPGSWQSMQLTALQTEVQCLTTDARGAVWAGLQNGSLYVLHPEQESFEKKQFPELKNAGPVRAMVSAPDGALWLATARGGIARFKDGRMSRLDRSRGLNSNGISQLVLDSQGRLWGAGDRGIFAAPLSSLNAAADGRSTLATVSFYGRREGVPSIQANSGYQPNAMVMASARLWFASRSGIVVADPTQPGTNLVPPPVAIEGLRVNGQRIDLHKQSIQIGPGVNSLRFDLAAMSFVEPQAVSLWHRLSRVDDTWVAADATRVAAYGSLAPGNYQLRVRATNNDGIPSRKDAVLDFVVLPFFWQTLPFQLGLGGILFTGTAVAAYRFSQMKSRRQTEAFKREADIQRERTRIARDMHDQIGASLTQIALLAELAEYEQERGKASASADDLKLLANTSREAVSHLDEIVWAVNPRHDNLGSLLEYVGEKALQMTHAAGLRCRLNLPQDVPHVSLNADFRHHVFLMIQEALNNAVKHAEAQEISLQVTTHDENGIEIKIRDDGRGFDPDEKRTAESTHDGLQNLSDRAQSLKGICTIFSLPDAGSTITIQLPWPKS